MYRQFPCGRVVHEGERTMNQIIREINGQTVEFTKSSLSEKFVGECLYFGSANGLVYLYESEDPENVVTTSANKWNVFAEAVTNGEFQVKN
jgi:hypothetical protein